MEILVLVKRVPATDSKIKVGADGKSIDPQGVEYVLNPYDEFAVEEALKTKEAKGGSVTVLTIGSGDAQKELRTCLAMGADKAVLLEGGEGADSHAIATALAAKAQELGAELIFCGKQSVDGDDAQVGARVATILSWACVTDANSFEIGDGDFSATRDIEGGKEKIGGQAARRHHLPKGTQRAALPEPQGNHGGQEEAARASAC